MKESLSIYIESSKYRCLIIQHSCMCLINKIIKNIYQNTCHTKLLYFFYEASSKIQIWKSFNLENLISLSITRKLIYHLTKNKKNKPEKVKVKIFKICSSSKCNDHPTMLKNPSHQTDRINSHKNQNDWSSSVTRPILKNAATLFLWAFRELIIHRELGNGQPSTNPYSATKQCVRD